MAINDLQANLLQAKRFKELLDQYRPWEKRFAWFPTIIDGKMIWCRTYYVRYKLAFPQWGKQRTASIFDILKD